MAETRETQVIEDVVKSTEIENPRTTEEAILAKIIAGEEVNINARTGYQSYLKELSSITGGNPNYTEIITSTLANPLGDSEYTLADLRELIESNEITITMQINASSVGYADFAIYAYIGNNGEYDYLLVKNIGLVGSSVDEWNAFYYLWCPDFPVDSVDAKVLDSGAVLNVSEYASLVTCTMTITHHPMP